MITVEFLTLENTDNMFIGDTVNVDGCIGFFQGRKGDINIVINFKEKRGLNLPSQMIGFHSNIISCRTVLTEKTIDFRWH